MVDFVHGEFKIDLKEKSVETKESIEDVLGKSTDDDGETTEKSAADEETTENAGRMRSTVKMGRLVDIVDHVRLALTSETY